MLSSSEVQRITLSATKVVKPAGSIELEEWDDDDRKSIDLEPTLDTEEGNENTTVEATTPISAAGSDLAVNRNGKHFGNFYKSELIFFSFNF
jgi:hypothetical protein